VAPRFGFSSPEDYYQKESVGPRLGRIRIPSLLVASENDPWVPAATIRPWLSGASDLLTVCWSNRGGHVGFPENLDLGLGPEPGLEIQVLSWLRGHHRRPS
jgi:predicted alpha/beta-fold hydrolase